jgi:hypothetical protein
MVSNQAVIGSRINMKKRRVPRLTHEQSLGALPVRNTLVEYRRTEEGEIEISIPRREDLIGKLMALAFFVPKKRKVVLEAIGSAVWEMCDGEHTVSQMIDALVKQHKLTRREVEASLTEYLRKLGKRRLIAFAVPKSMLEKKS